MSPTQSDTNKLINALKIKAKKGWKLYFMERDGVHRLQAYRNRLREEASRLPTRAGDEEYDHLRNMFLELYKEVGKLCDCPVCFETMTKEITAVPSCGHLVCKACKEKMTECPICRKKY
jgi:hypothetical protein